jgi:phage shock protein PspC (stress-responsive transcriptional regulator)
MAGGQAIAALDDRLLGACYALGRALGLAPVYLRLVFALFTVWAPALALAAYAILTAVVTLSRWAFHQGMGVPR